MSPHSRYRVVRESAKAALVAALCAMLAAPDALAAVPAAGIPSHPHVAPLTKQEKVLHALNRLTFGPHPGDEAAVERMGLKAWFNQQLHPDSIDDSAFEQRLAQLPSSNLPIRQLLLRFPEPQRLRQMALRGQPMPQFNDPVEQAIWTDSEARIKARIEARDQKAATPAPSMNAMNPGMNAGGNMMDAAPPDEPVSSFTREQAEEIVSLPPDARFERIVQLPAADEIRFARLTQRELPRVLEGLTPQQRDAFMAMQQPERVVASEALQARLLRDVYSQRQLQAVMTDFWLNHFSIYVRKDQFEPYLLSSYERDVILPNSLGSFEQLLVATAESPAMLLYLDNWESVGPHSPAAERFLRFRQKHPDAAAAKRAPQGINENYGRELMELHTIGVNGGYTQKDVIEVAKCFTGWTIERGPNAASPGTFRFDPARHEPGSKTVMGVKIPEGGMQEGLTVLHMLATSPQAAHFISNKLAVRFVSDNPPPALVNRMAATFLKTNGDIASVLSTMFHSREFWSPQVYRAKIKTPVEFMVSALRASDAQIDQPELLVQAVQRLGMPIYGMQTPNGYSWQSSDWVSTGGLVDRMNFALVLASDHVRGTEVDWANLLHDPAAATAAEPGAADEKHLEQIILGEPASQHTRDVVLTQFNTPGMQSEAQKNFNLHPPAAKPMFGMPGRRPKAMLTQGASFTYAASQPETPLDTMAGLLLGSPDFQRR